MKVLDFTLPKDYYEFLNSENELDIYLDSGECLYLYPIASLEEENHIEIVPVVGFFAIGNSGGDVGIFYNKENGYIYSMPYTGMNECDALKLSESFKEFMERFMCGEIEIY